MQGGGADCDGAALRHSVAGVDEHVEHGHLEVNWIHQTGKRARAQVELQRDLAACRSVEHLAELYQQGIQVRGLRIEACLAGERQELLGEPGAPFSGCTRVLQRTAQPLVL